jgi:branched-chain amino acid aminotransferase
MPNHWSTAWFRERILALCAANHVASGGRVRLTFFRDGGGRYTPESDGVFWVGDLEKLDRSEYTLNETGLRVDIYPDMKKPLDHLANFKNLSSTLYVQSALWAKQRSFEEALIQNTRNHVIESTRSNLFLVSNSVLYTSGLSSGATGGIMRSAVARIASANGYQVYECDLTPQELLRADELFLTNAIRGIQWVSSYRTKRYFSTTSQRLTELLNASLERPA